jgi:N-acetylneuraminic acid mutarotase
MSQKKMNRRKQYFRVLIAFYSLLILLFVNTCQKIDLTREAFVQTNSFSIGDGTITLTGTIIDLGEGISDHGFVMSLTPDPLTSSEIVLGLGSASETGQFTYNVSGLGGGVNFYFRAFATSGGETIYGESSNFSTPDLDVATQTATIQSKSSAIINGAIINLGFESVTDHGFFWAEDPTPQNFSQNKIPLGATTDATTFNYTLTELTPYTEYFFIAYARNNSETKFGNVVSFKMENVWTRIQNFNGSARCRALAFSLEEFGYIAGGHDAGSINDFYQFNPDPETWISISTGSSPVYGTAFTIGNKAYVIDWNNLYEFDPDEGIWVHKTLFPGPARSEMFAFNIGNKGYVGGGGYWDGTQHIYLNDFWEFDPQDDITNGTDINGDPMGSWTQKVDFQGTGRLSGEGFSIATFGYVCSGYNDIDLNDFWQYDPYSTDNGTDANGNPMGAWSQKTDYPGPPGTEMVSFIIHNKAYLFNYELWQYNPLTENWKQMADFPGQPRYAPVGFAINNKGYVGTGTYNDGGGDLYLDDFWEYLPVQ